MPLPDRKEYETRKLLTGGPPQPVPPDLAERARLRGARLLHRRRRALLALCALLLAGLAVLAGWAYAARPGMAPPSGTTPTARW